MALSTPIVWSGREVCERQSKQEHGLQHSARRADQAGNQRYLRIWEIWGSVRGDYSESALIRKLASSPLEAMHPEDRYRGTEVSSTLTYTG